MRWSGVARSTRVPVVVVILLCLLIWPQVTSADPVPIYVPLLGTYTNQSVAQAYYQNLFSGVTTRVASGSGVISPTFATIDPAFGYGYSASVTKTIHVPVIDYSHTYGVSDTWVFNGQGPITYTANAPFTLEATVPSELPQGISINLDGALTWNSPTVSGNEPLSLSTYHETWADFPGDGLDDLVLSVDQQPDTLTLTTEVPVAPGLDSVSLGPVTVPFGGQQSYDAYSVDLASDDKVLNTLAANSWIRSQTGEPGSTGTFVYVKSDASITGWSATAEMIQLTENALLDSGVPVAVAVGAGLTLVSTVGGFTLDVSGNMNIVREDGALIMLTAAPTVRVPLILPTGHYDSLPLSGSFYYQSWATSIFYYQPGLSVNIDGYGWDPENLISWYDGAIFVDSFSTPMTSGRVDFTLTVPNVDILGPIMIEAPELRFGQLVQTSNGSSVLGWPVDPNPVTSSSVVLPSETCDSCTPDVPVPEPASLLLLGTGLVGLARMRKCRQQGRSS